VRERELGAYLLCCDIQKLRAAWKERTIRFFIFATNLAKSKYGGQNTSSERKEKNKMK
jgi:hypothetical protein